MRRRAATIGIVLTLMPFERNEEIAMAQAAGAPQQIAAAFESVRKGDASLIGGLVHYGDAVIPAVLPLVTDTDPTVRREAVARSMPSTTLPLPLPLRRHYKIHRRKWPSALHGLSYASCYAWASTKYRGSMRPGRSQQSMGRPACPDCFCWGFTHGGESALRTALSAKRLVKLTDADEPVPAALPAAIALSLRGDSKAPRNSRNGSLAIPPPASFLCCKSST